MDETELRQQAEKGGFFSYACGVAYHIVRSYDVGGIEITNYKTTLPHAKGLSSSAAICVLVARAFNRAYDLKMSARCDLAKCLLLLLTVSNGNNPVLISLHEQG